MYLSMLNDTQKELFLELAYKLASIDGNYTEQEQFMIKGYCAEMQIEFQHIDISKSIEEIIELMQAECSEREKRIILFEAIGLALIDSDYDERERKMVGNMVEVFRIKNGFDKDCEKLLKEYIGLQNRINTLVLG